MKEEQLWITTNDNPFDFFTQFDDWYLFDESKGYHTCSLVARVARPGRCPSASGRTSVAEGYPCRLEQDG